ncbi:DUF2871 domain-containing protein [Streptomyces sp. NPDC052042]|uniref:DUF2871 domain-containing protein n=1 Tax=Streptomyces sp. NPDC052042 TaxID=3365683 RepID=UPI0037D5CFFF
MQKLYYSAVLYTVLGLAAGLYYREVTKAHDFTGTTQLAVLHTHLLTLGTLVFLITLALQKTLHLTRGRFFPAFFWTYHAGLLLTTALMAVHGTLTVLGKDTGAAISGIAGLGHILLTLALVFFFLCLHHRLRPDFAGTTQTDTSELTGADRTHG